MRLHAAGHSHSGHRGPAQRRKVHPIQPNHWTAARHRRRRARHHARPHHGTADTTASRFSSSTPAASSSTTSDYIPSQILQQAEVALENRHPNYLPGGWPQRDHRHRTATSPLCSERLGKPVTLAVNKIDTHAREILIHEFHSLGIADVFPVSAEHGIGMEATARPRHRADSL